MSATESPVRTWHGKLRYILPWWDLAISEGKMANEMIVVQHYNNNKFKVMKTCANEPGIAE